MLRKQHREKLAVGALIVLGFIIYQVLSQTTTSDTPTTLQAPITTVAATVSTQGVVETAPTTLTTPTTTPTTPSTIVVPTAVEGQVLSRTGSSTVPLLITGIVLVMLGTAVEFRARRPGTSPALTLQPIPTVAMAGILHELARARRAASEDARARAADLASRRHPPKRDIGAWRYRA